MAYYLKDLPFTEEGKMLKLSDEDRERFRLVYKREGDGWVLHDIYEKGGEYGDDCIVVPLESTYKGWEYIDQGVSFSNVIGSTYDSKPIDPDTNHEYRNWIELWEKTYKRVNNENPVIECCTDEMVYETRNQVEYQSNLHITRSERGCIICGGHVIKGNLARSISIGSLVYIVPICMRHDHIKTSEYMKMGNRTFAVKLDYMIIPHNYLAQRPLETHEKI